MTREEAILCLKGMKNYARDTFTEQTDWQDSLDMAIKSLENEEKLLKENRTLKNRCRVQTQGLLCSFCPLECEQRAEDYKGEVND